MEINRIILISLGVIELIFVITFLYLGYNYAKDNYIEGGIYVIGKKKITDKKKGITFEIKSGYHLEKKTTLQCIGHGFKEAFWYVYPVNLFLVFIFIGCWLICNLLKYLINFLY